MSNSTNTLVTRREFVIATGSIAGLALLPGSALGASSKAGAMPASATGIGSCSVSCDFVSIDGIPRPRAWRLADGTALELEPGTFAAEVAFRSPTLPDETLRAHDFETGYAQELIRRHFGDEVLCQARDELDRFTLQTKRS